MRHVLAIMIALGLVACGNGPRDGGGADLSTPADCPSGLQSPAYCFAAGQGTGATCGDCSTVGERCDYFEATLVCAADHKWRCAWAGGSSGGCPHGDGGL